MSKALPINVAMEKAYQRLQHVTDLISEHPQMIFAVSALANLADCSANQLKRNFADVLSKIPSAYQARSRAHFAASLIRAGTALSDVATESGSSDQTSFSRFWPSPIKVVHFKS